MKTLKSPETLNGFGTFDPTDLTAAAKAALKEASGNSRRDFLRNTGLMLIGFGVAAKAPSALAQSPISPNGLVDATQLDSWIAIGADESITAFTGKVELGQGIRTVQYQLVAEELSVPLSRVRLIMGVTGITPDQGTTSGSQSTITEFGG